MITGEAWNTILYSQTQLAPSFPFSYFLPVPLWLSFHTPRPLFIPSFISPPQLPTNTAYPSSAIVSPRRRFDHPVPLRQAHKVWPSPGYYSCTHHPKQSCRPMISRRRFAGSMHAPKHPINSVCFLGFFSSSSSPGRAPSKAPSRPPGVL